MKTRKKGHLKFKVGPSWKDDAGDRIKTWEPTAPGFRLTEFGWEKRGVDGDPVDAFDVWYHVGGEVWEVVQHYDGARIEYHGDDEEGAFIHARDLNLTALGIPE